MLALAMLSAACAVEDVDDLDDLESLEDQDDREDIVPPQQSEPGLDETPGTPTELMAKPDTAEVGGRKCCDGYGLVPCINAAPCGGCDATYHVYVECVAYPGCVNPYCHDGWVEVNPGSWQCNGRRWVDDYPACDGLIGYGCDECL